MSNSEHSPGKTCIVVSPNSNTIFPVLLIETFTQSSRISNVPLSTDNTGSPVDHPFKYITKVPGS